MRKAYLVMRVKSDGSFYKFAPIYHRETLMKLIYAETKAGNAVRVQREQ